LRRGVEDLKRQRQDLIERINELKSELSKDAKLMNDMFNKIRELRKQNEDLEEDNKKSDYSIYGRSPVEVFLELNKLCDKARDVILGERKRNGELCKRLIEVENEKLDIIMLMADLIFQSKNEKTALVNHALKLADEITDLKSVISSLEHTVVAGCEYNKIISKKDF